MFQAIVGNPNELPSLLTSFLLPLSDSRRQIAIDQIRSAFVNPDEVILLTAIDSDSQVGGAVLVHQANDLARSKRHENATIIHAGWINRPQNDSDSNNAITALRELLTQTMRDRNATFLQWATDPLDTLSIDTPGARWPKTLGMESIVTLQYMTRGMSDRPVSTEQNAATSSPPLRFRPIDWNNSHSRQQFTAIVENSYSQTLDCPDMVRYRTAEQTLAGYRQNGCYAPELWLEVTASDNSPVGCLVMGHHRPADDSAHSVLELVYMGVLPTARGHGYGNAILRETIQRAQTLGAANVILAVDEQNHPARKVYAAAGFQPLLRESVWVKSLCKERGEV